MRTGRLDKKSAYELLEERSIKPVSGCVEYTGHKNRQGYGRLRFGGSKHQLVHRFAYETYLGPIPDGVLVCHHCDNPPCINPDHLVLGSHQDNVNDKIRKGRGV